MKEGKAIPQWFLSSYNVVMVQPLWKRVRHFLKKPYTLYFFTRFNTERTVERFAALVQKKGNKNVSTLHKLLYESFPKPDGGFYRRPKPALGYKIIVVDEVSMVPKSLIDLLFSHKDLYILCLGDPMQLPPISKEEDNHLLDKPDIFLDKIMRQAE